MNRNKLLFVTEKFCDGTPDLALTNSFHNVFSTFSQAYGGQYNWNTIHLDEASVVYGTHVDKFLVDYCKKFDIGIIIFSLLGQSPSNPSMEIYKQLRELGIYLCFLWPDTGAGWATQTILQLAGRSDLHISWDNPKSPFHETFPFPDNWMPVWVPQDRTMFYKQEGQDIGASFIGSPRYYDRRIFLNFLLGNCPWVQIRGGQREEKLTPEGYAELIRRSKISINFSLSPAQFFQTKGRVFEVMACGSMLLEFKNPATSSLFTPNEDYVEFETPQELVDKIRYYSEHEDERKKIAEKGYETYNAKYTSRHYWERIMTRIQSDLSKRDEQTRTIDSATSNPQG
jgi:hypothetical protein